MAENQVEFSGSCVNGVCHFYSTDGYIEGWLEPFPGSDQMWISYDLFCYPAARGTGLATQYNDFIKEFVRSRGGRAIIATVSVKNIAQHRRLTRLGWQQLSKTLWMTTVGGEDT